MPKNIPTSHASTATPHSSAPKPKLSNTFLTNPATTPFKTGIPNVSFPAGMGIIPDLSKPPPCLPTPQMPPVQLMNPMQSQPSHDDEDEEEEEEDEDEEDPLPPGEESADPFPPFTPRKPPPVEVSKPDRKLLPTARSSVCHFCPKPLMGLPPGEPQRHVLTDHLPNCFECRSCDGVVVSVDAEGMRRHLKTEHGIDPLMDRGRMMAATKFPADCRQAKCIKCGQAFLSQDAAQAYNHLVAKHEVPASTASETGKALLVFSCRCCSSRLSGPDAFEGHAESCAMAKAGSALAIKSLMDS